LILQGRKNRLNKLVEKEKTEGLNKDEKDFLRRLLQF
jgi:uncharacterized protein YnzC (UPF0291/DUF896 family)